eukprot:TRINITY_DN13574_c1_g2_i1.p1 TRINITY_DN13574_c1_g2~~TRINITY_DN13574_c1_g2_i1.p1  ORF type:complete len:506 (+),score=132.65 TRINITY_DN13574_c1_g2_i1:163-1518(+)
MERRVRQLLKTKNEQKAEHFRLDDEESDCENDVPVDFLGINDIKGSEIVDLIDLQELQPSPEGSADGEPSADALETSLAAFEQKGWQGADAPVVDAAASADEEALPDLWACPTVCENLHALDKATPGSCSIDESADVSGTKTIRDGVKEEEECSTDENSDSSGDSSDSSSDGVNEEWFSAAARALGKANAGSCSTAKSTDVSGDLSDTSSDGVKKDALDKANAGSCSTDENADHSGVFIQTISDGVKEEEYVEEMSTVVAHGGRGRGRGRSLGSAAVRASRDDEGDKPTAIGGRLRSSSRDRRTARAEPRDYRWNLQQFKENGYYQMQIFSFVVHEMMDVLSEDIDDYIAAGSFVGWTVTEILKFDLDYFRQVLRNQLKDYYVDWSNSSTEDRVIRLWKQFEPVMLARVRRKATEVRELIPSDVYAPSEASTEAEDNIDAEESDDEWQYVS